MKIIERNERKMVLCGLDCLSELSSIVDANGFAVMLPAYSKEEVHAMLGLASALVELGCRELCCVGTFASEMEDELDVTLEDRGDIDIATTSFADEADAAEYFVFAAGGAQEKLLVAVVDSHATLVDQLMGLWVENTDQERL